MPYKISGSKSETARIIVLKESDWSIESNTVISGSGAYEVDSLVSGDKLILARTNDGWIKGFGSVVAEEYVPSVGDRGLVGGGLTTAVTNTIEYITISTTGNTTNFGDLTVARRDIAATDNGVTGRGIFDGGYTTTYVNTIDYVTILSPSDATDFGDLTYARISPASASNGVNDRGVFAGGGKLNGYVNIIDYITISSPSDANDFGDLTPEGGVGRRLMPGASNGTNDRAVFLGGYTGTIYKNLIDYVTISSLGNSIFFGALTQYVRYGAGVSNKTNERAIRAGGATSGVVYLNVIDYITISSAGNAQDFGDITVIRSRAAGCSNGTNERGVFSGGTTGSRVNVIDYITISTLSDATDFGDLTTATEQIAGCSNA